MKWQRWLPLLLFGFALGLRLVGIDWGLKNDLHNASYHPDEPIVFGYSRSIEPSQGQFVPHFYNYGTLYLTLLRVTSDVATTYTGGPSIPGGWSWTNPAKTDWDWVSRCHKAGRILSSLAGAGTVVFLFLIGRRFYGDLGGVAAALTLAVAPAHVVHSRFQTVDVLATFFLAGSLWFSLRLLNSEGDKEGLKLAALSGAFAGLSMGTKYTGVLALLALFTALALAKRPNWVKEALIGLAVTGLVFVLSTPGCLLDSAKFWEDFGYEMRHTATGHGLVFAGTANGFIYHFVNLVTGVGPLLVLLGVLGLGYSAFRRNQWVLVVLAFAIPYYLLIGRAEVKFMRYTLPLELAIALGVGFAAAAGHRKGGWGKLAVAGALVGIGGIPVGGLRSATTLTGMMLSPDPRDQAMRSLREKSAGTVGLALDPWFWSIPVEPNAASPRSVPWPLRQQAMASATAPAVAYVVNPDGSPTFFDSKLISQVTPERIVFTSLECPPNVLRLLGRKDLPPEYQGQVDSIDQFQKALSDRYDTETLTGTMGLGGEFEVEDMRYIQPTVWIWKLKTAAR